MTNVLRIWLGGLLIARVHTILMLLAVFAIGPEALADTDGQPQTRAERTDYQETSHYEDVISFIGNLQTRGAPISVQYIGTSTKGRGIPLVIASRPLVASPAHAHRLDKPVVYVQANIHAGEVEGKEAAQMLLRDLSQEPAGGLLDKIVLLTTPIYNIDGNESWGPQNQNRRYQYGPEIVGIRANGQGLDLNRDYVKVESPEVWAALQHIFTTWDPDVFMDLHATDGTIHGYRLTYSPPLNPDTEAGVLRYTRDELLPNVRKILHKEYSMEIFDYGNTPWRGGELAWYTNEPEPRYGTNYVGLRNRISILSEAMSHLSFRDRVEATYRFVHTILQEVARDGKHVINLTRQADARVIGWGLSQETAPPMGVRFDFDIRGEEEVLLEEPASPDKLGIEDRSRKPGPPKTIVKVKMPICDRFKATRTSRFPAAYFIPAELPEVAELLLFHGIVVQRLLSDWQGTCESFMIEKIKTTEQPFQGHRLNQLEGRFETLQTKIPSGSYFVRTAQPLGILIFHLLEPESLDGVAAWNFLDRSLSTDKPYPIHKCFEQLNVACERLH